MCVCVCVFGLNPFHSLSKKTDATSAAIDHTTAKVKEFLQPNPGLLPQGLY